MAGAPRLVCPAARLEQPERWIAHHAPLGRPTDRYARLRHPAVATRVGASGGR